MRGEQMDKNTDRQQDVIIFLSFFQNWERRLKITDFIL
jgi:hypothetical protein